MLENQEVQAVQKWQNKGSSQCPTRFVNKRGNSAQESIVLWFTPLLVLVSMLSPVSLCQGYTCTSKICNLFFARDYTINSDLPWNVPYWGNVWTPTRMDSVLPRCKESLLSACQVRILASSELRASSNLSFWLLLISGVLSRLQTVTICNYRRHHVVNVL